VSSCLPAYSFVLTPFEALGSFPSPESDDFINEFLGFPHPEPAPATFVSTSSSTRRAPLTLVYYRSNRRPSHFHSTPPGLWTPIKLLARPLLGLWGATWLGKCNQLSTHFLTFGAIFRAYPFSPENVISVLKRYPRYPVPWDFTQPTGHLATPTEVLTPMVTPEAGPSTSLGKRSRERYETYSYGCLAGSRHEQRRRRRTRRP
jgi:hypothetical protein